MMSLSIRSRAGLWLSLTMVGVAAVAARAVFRRAQGAEGSSAENLGTWRTLTSEGSPPKGSGYSAVWTGEEMIIWGGAVWAAGQRYSQQGWRYNPRTDRWQPTSTQGAPRGRVEHAAVWTGNEMIVWGGSHETEPYRDGGAYDPLHDRWRPLSMDGAPASANRPAMLWTGREVLVFSAGRADQGGPGGRYDPALDRWRPMSLEVEPPPPYSDVPTVLPWQTGPVVWTGTEMLLWSGEAIFRYDPERDHWRVSRRPPYHVLLPAMVWDGQVALLWGGGVGETPVRAMMIYEPGRDVWRQPAANCPSGGAPPGAIAPLGFFTGREVLVWGGYAMDSTWSRRSGFRSGVQASADGARWTPGSHFCGWHPVEPNGALPLSGPVGVWTGQEMLVWGAMGGRAMGARYTPPAAR